MWTRCVIWLIWCCRYLYITLSQKLSNLQKICHSKYSLFLNNKYIKLINGIWLLCFRISTAVNCINKNSTFIYTHVSYWREITRGKKVRKVYSLWTVVLNLPWHYNCKFVPQKLYCFKISFKKYAIFGNSFYNGIGCNQ